MITVVGNLCSGFFYLDIIHFTYNSPILLLWKKTLSIKFTILTIFHYCLYSHCCATNLQDFHPTKLKFYPLNNNFPSVPPSPQPLVTTILIL